MYTILDWLTIQQAPAAPAPITDPARLLPIKGTPSKRWLTYKEAVDFVAPHGYPSNSPCPTCGDRRRYFRNGNRVDCLRPDCKDGRIRYCAPRPYGGSWLRVQGRPESDLPRKHAKGFRAWLKQVDKQCRANPSKSFRYTPRDCKRPGCTAEEFPRNHRNERYPENRLGKRAASIDDALVQLQLLGVTV